LLLAWNQKGTSISQTCTVAMQRESQNCIAVALTDEGSLSFVVGGDVVGVAMVLCSHTLGGDQGSTDGWCVEARDQCVAVGRTHVGNI